MALTPADRAGGRILYHPVSNLSIGGAGQAETGERQRPDRYPGFMRFDTLTLTERIEINGGLRP
ncbi:hypothetical protein LN650_19060 [Klebsiella pneumoniae subsp. pneumoniae]|nr:hypothetical protein [Klebsiella pneumoniae subsp. pneumoniae]